MLEGRQGNEFVSGGFSLRSSLAFCPLSSPCPAPHSLFLLFMELLPRAHMLTCSQFSYVWNYPLAMTHSFYQPRKLRLYALVFCSHALGSKPSGGGKKGSHGCGGLFVCRPHSKVNSSVVTQFLSSQVPVSWMLQHIFRLRTELYSEMITVQDFQGWDSLWPHLIRHCDPKQSQTFLGQSQSMELWGGYSA